MHISVFGLRNAGKSTLVNALTGQNLSIVNEKPGTTTDPVSKAMEILPLRVWSRIRPGWMMMRANLAHNVSKRRMTFS